MYKKLFGTSNQQDKGEGVPKKLLMKMISLDRY